MRKTWICGLVAALVVSAALFGQDSVRGHWTGDIEIPGHSMGMVVDLDKTDKGWIGAIGIPEQGSSGLPLTDIRVEGNKCTFRIKGVPGDPTFNGSLSADAKIISGDFSQGGGTFPFKMTRAGDPKIEERKTSPAIAKELVGTWEGTLDVGGQSLRLVLKLANDSEGAKGTLISVDQGGAEIDVTTIAQSGSKLDLIVRPIGGEYHAELTPAGTALKGTWSQNGNDLPLELTKKAEPAPK
jgi:hypothetical protein